MADMQTPFALILHGGNARVSALEAIAFADKEISGMPVKR